MRDQLRLGETFQRLVALDPCLHAIVVACELNERLDVDKVDSTRGDRGIPDIGIGPRFAEHRRGTGCSPRKRLASNCASNSCSVAWLL
jgi:hypothetical protein